MNIGLSHSSAELSFITFQNPFYFPFLGFFSIYYTYKNTINTHVIDLQQFLFWHDCRKYGTNLLTNQLQNSNYTPFVKHIRSNIVNILNLILHQKNLTNQAW